VVVDGLIDHTHSGLAEFGDDLEMRDTPTNHQAPWRKKS
jgi:hypothetical protein